MAGKDRTVVGLDVGTTKICALVAEMAEEKEIRVVGVGTQPSSGLKKGEVVNIEKTVEAVEKAVAQAEQVSGLEIDSAYVGITGGHIQSFNNRSLLPVAKPRMGVTVRDIEKVVEAAQAIALPSGQEVIHVIPQEFSVDQQEGILDPEGMLGSRLEARVHIVTGAISAIQNIVKSVNQAGIEMEDIVLQQLAASLAVLRQEEQKSGVLLMDIGGGTTDYVLFHDEVVRSTGVLNIGGDHLTNDISIGLKLLQSQAEEAKKKFGCVLSSPPDQADCISFPAIMGRASSKISRGKLCHIIELRLKEIFSLVKEELEERNLFGGLGAGVVLTGGSALLKGITELGSETLACPVRVGRPWGVTGLMEVIDSPAYASAVGLVKYGFQHRASPAGRRSLMSGSFARALQRLGGWLGKYF